MYDTVLYPFLETETSDRTFMGRDQVRVFKVPTYTPFHLVFTAPLNGNWIKFLLIINKFSHHCQHILQFMAKKMLKN